MQHFAVYDKDTGALVSTGTVVADDLPDHLAVTDGWDGAEWEAPGNVPGLRWNASERRFTRSTLDVSKAIIDGTPTDTATVTFRTDDSIPPESITFLVNEAPTEVDVVDGVAAIDVTSQTPGDTVTVTVDHEPSLVGQVQVAEAADEGE